jgi:hypothetical protein
MLSLEEDELRQLQREVAAKRGESRGFNRYRDVMQQTLQNLKREVAHLRDDVVAAQARAAAASPQVRAAAATGREAQAKRNLQAWIERQEAARTARHVANTRPAGPDFSRPSPLRAGAGVGGAAFSLKRQAPASPKELREENELLRKRMELLLPEVQSSAQSGSGKSVSCTSRRRVTSPCSSRRAGGSTSSSRRGVRSRPRPHTAAQSPRVSRPSW